MKCLMCSEVPRVHSILEDCKVTETVLSHCFQGNSFGVHVHSLGSAFSA